MDMTTRPVLLVSSSPFGLLNSMMVLAAELASRDVPVWLAVDEERRANVEAIDGVRFVSLGPGISENAPSTWDDRTYRKTTQPGRFRAFRAAVLHTSDPNMTIGKYKRLREIIEELDPALMVADNDFAIYALRLASSMKVPYAISSPYMPSYVSFRDLPPGYPAPFSGLRPRMTVRQRLINWMFKPRVVNPLLLNVKIVRDFSRFFKQCEELGISRADRMIHILIRKSRLILCYTVPGLDYPFAHPGKLHMVGAMIPPLPESDGDPDLNRWLDAHESVIYLGLGTLTRLSRDEVAAFVDVARKLDGTHHVLWKLPAAQQALLPTDLPPNLRIEDWLPSQIDVLAHPNVRLFVNHGGANGFHEGLYFGKPLLIRPLWADCYDQAVRGEDAGVSLTIDSHSVDIDDITAKINRLLTDPSFRTRAEYFRDQQLAAGGRETAAERITTLLTEL
jgi:polyene glycosyltransferase